MSGYFIGPLVLAFAWALIWGLAAKYYNRGAYPRDVAPQVFSGPVKEYVFPSGFFAALACLLSTLLSDAVRALPHLADLLRAAAFLFCIASLIGLVVYQSLENMRSQDGLKITLTSSVPIASLGVIYALLTVAVATTAFAVWNTSGIPPKVEEPKSQATVKVVEPAKPISVVCTMQETSAARLGPQEQRTYHGKRPHHRRHSARGKPEGEPAGCPTVVPDRDNSPVGDGSGANH